MSVDELKKQLYSIDFYQQYPSMTPFVGSNYESNAHKKLLIVAESFYFPNSETLHREPQKWYQSTAKDLDNPKHVDWIDLKYQFEHHVKKNFIYKKLDSCILASHLVINKGHRGIDEFAFTNFFQRPARDMQSFKWSATPLDLEKSQEILGKVLSILQPDIVIFVSKYAYSCLGNVKKLFPQIKFFVTYHPQCRYWLDKKYDGRGIVIRILNEEFVKIT